MRNEVNRAHKAKTTLRYLLSLVAILSVVSVSAATFGTTYQRQRRGIQYAQLSTPMPTLAMSSTGSVMMQSGSTLPMAAVTGTTSADDYAPSSGPRRAKKDVGGGEDTEDEEENTHIGEPSPIGDAAVPMMLMAMLFAGVIYTRRKKALKG